MSSCVLHDIDPALSDQDLLAKLQMAHVPARSVSRILQDFVPTRRVLLHLHSADAVSHFLASGIYLDSQIHRVTSCPSYFANETPPQWTPSQPSSSHFYTTPIATTTSTTITTTIATTSTPSIPLYPSVPVTTVITCHPSPLMTSFLPVCPSPEGPQHLNQPPETSPSTAAALPSSPPSTHAADAAASAAPPSTQSSSTCHTMYSCVIRGVDPALSARTILQELQAEGVPVRRVFRIKNSSGPTYMVRIHLPTAEDVQRLIANGAYIYRHRHKVEPSLSPPQPIRQRFNPPYCRPRPIPPFQPSTPVCPRLSPPNFFPPPPPTLDIIRLLITSLNNITTILQLLTFHFHPATFI